MTETKIFVFDTNALLSAFLVTKSTSDKAFKRAIAMGALGMSEMLLDEFMEVLWRPKFDKYFSNTERDEILQEVLEHAVYFSPTELIAASSDIDDNFMLELGLAAKADCIISGDPHLKNLHPFRGIPILSPADFLHQF